MSSTRAHRGSLSCVNLRRCFWLSLVFAIVLPGKALAWPAESDWIAVTRDQQPFQDDDSDFNNQFNLVGDGPSVPSVFVFNDGAYLQFRFRIDKDPLNNAGTELTPFGWGVLIDVSLPSDLTSYEWMLMLDGITEELYLAENTDPNVTPLGDPSDKAERIEWTEAAILTPPGSANYRVIDAGTAINGDTDYFLDFRINYDVFKLALGVTDSSPIKFFFGTSASAQTLSKDLSSSDDTLVGGVSDFYLPTGATPADGSVKFTTTLGGAIDDLEFGVGEFIYPTVTDPDQNSLPSAIETVSVELTALSGESETFVLNETGVDTGIFSRAIPTAQVQPNPSPPPTNLYTSGTLEVDPIEIITVTYLDEIDADNDFNETRTDTITVKPSSDLEVIKTVSNATPIEMEAISFLVTVQNNGPSDSISGQIYDLLPAGVTYVSHSATSGSYNKNTGFWNFGAIANGATQVLTVNITVNAGTANTTITNDAGISATAQTDNNAANDEDSASIAILGADLAITKSVDEDVPDAGDTVVFTVVATNNGTGAANDVRVTDLLPAGLSYVSSNTTTTETYDDPSGVWEGFSLASGFSETLTITATVTGSPGDVIVNSATIAEVSTPTPVLDPNPDNNTADVTLNVGATDLQVVKSVSPLQAAEGDTVTFTLDVTNLGPNDATNVDVNDLLPTTVTYVSHATANGTYTPGTGLWDLASGLTYPGPGDTATLTIDATVNTGTANSTITNTATVSATQIDPAPANDTDDAELEVLFAELGIVKTVDNSTPADGDTLTFDIVVTNNGTGEATNIEATDYFPPQVDTITATPSYPTQGSFSTTTGVWDIGTLAAAASATMRFTAIVDIGPSDPKSFYNSASITALDQTDEVGTNDTSAVAIKVDGTDLAITKTVNDDSPTNGDSVSFDIVITNLGPNIATGIEITDSLPAGWGTVTATGGTPTVGSYNSAQGEWTITSLAVSASATLTLTGTVTAATGDEVTNEAAITDVDQADTITTNNVATDSFLVGATDIAVTKTVVGASVVDEGDTVTFEIQATNNGPNIANNLVIQDNLPTGLTYDSDSTLGVDYDDGTGLWTLPTSLAVSATASIQITATVDTGTSGDIITNNAEIDSLDEPEQNPANNFASAGITVKETDLTVNKITSDATPLENGTTTFTVTATNLGPDDATNVVVTDLLPAGLDYVDHDVLTGTYDENTGIWNIGPLAKNVSVQLSIDVQISGVPDVGIDNTAEITGTEADTNLANNISTVTVTPQPIPMLVVTKTATPDDDVASGEAIVYLISVVNEGGADAHQVEVIDDMSQFIELKTNGGTPLDFDPGISNLAVGTITYRDKNGSTHALSVDPYDPDVAEWEINMTDVLKPDETFTIEYEVRVR